VSEHQDHAGAVADVLRLPQPQLRVRVLQDGEQSVILRERDGEFDRTAVEIRQEGTAAARLRFIRVGVRVGRVIVKSEPVHQFPVPVCGWRPEPDSVPLAGVLPHGRQPLIKESPGNVPAVVPEPVHPDFAAVVLQRTDRFAVNLVAGTDEVPRRPVSAYPLRRAQQVHIAVANGGLHVMGEHKSPRSAGRPQAEERHRPARHLSDHREQPAVEVVEAVLDRPPREGRRGLHVGEQAPQPELNRPGQGRTREVIAAQRGGAAESGNGGTPDIPVSL
jgi:hypothetical protein